MMFIRIKHEAPGPWRSCISGKPAWLLPFLVVEWPLGWLAFALSRWSFLDVLEHLGSLSVLVAVIFYFSEASDRLKQKHYQAWQVVNTAQHMDGSGGRIEALGELNADGVPLVGVDVSSAFLQGVQLPQAKLGWANFTATDVRNSNLEGTDLSYASLNGANFRQSNLDHAVVFAANLTDANLCGAHLRGANLSDAVLDAADLGDVDLSGVARQQIRSIKKMNLSGVRNAPAGFLAWALKNGAVQLQSNPNCPVGGEH